jgi:CxxC-x17-CxxC domain-containing protein
MCNNLSNKKYCILNKEYSKEEYFNKLNEINSNKELFDDNLNIFSTNKQNFPKKSYEWNNVENCSWDYIYDSKNTKESFDCFWNEDCAYLTMFQWSKNCYDCYSWWADDFKWIAELCYESLSTWSWVSNILFSAYCWEKSFNVISSYYCIWSNNLFGCIWLKNKEYCILNKQYSKEEYEILVPKIIEHMKNSWEWWEFFPSSISPFWYNESAAIEYFPLDKNSTLENWFNWSDFENPFPKVDKIIKASMLPDDIFKIPDDILNWAIECETSWKPFRIIKQELDFYRKYWISIPKKHPDVRHLNRVNKRNPRKLFERICDKCGKDIKTTYAPDRKEIVYCEECYNKEVY